MNYNNKNLSKNTETLKYIRKIMTYKNNQTQNSFLIQLGENLIKIKESLPDYQYKNNNISNIQDIINFELTKTNIMTFIEAVNDLLDYLIEHINYNITKYIKCLIYALADKGLTIKGIGLTGQIEESDNQFNDDDSDDDSDDGGSQYGGKKSTKKSSIKKAPVKKAPVKKAPVKKAPVKKAPVKKAPVKNPKSKK